MSYEKLMCTENHKRRRVDDKQKHDTICVGAAAHAIAQLETALCVDIAEVCIHELVFNERLP